MAYNENSAEYNHLEELGGSDYEIVDGQPNIKGWDVKNEQGQVIGEVDELLFNPATQKVRYIVLDTDANDLALEARKVLIPIGVAELHENDDDVIVPYATKERLETLPAYTGNELTAATETAILTAFSGAGAAGMAAVEPDTYHNQEFYNQEHYNPNKLYERRNTNTDYSTPVNRTEVTGSADETNRSIPVIEENLHVGKQQVETGTTRVTTNMVERPVEETVNLKQERVHVERTPVNRLADSSDLDTFKEGQIELTEHTEVPVVNKEARVVEEVTINKNVEEREEIIRDTVRNTEVETERLNRNNDSL
ncbi:DUF2382 domain-containing protein [Mucilaginibacter lacusdianchii]|uniref:DUF2382 domain-containing protein n=1 Tax=Mucilaginibacter lacusdianchii TaxID=2684211 RepID=UPI00131BACB9|nr:PRC and DUF2382 domain-containing protein [Mucilaginibacter sp. JXJ CY 39]